MDKKQARKERKTKKMLALLELVRLNDSDRASAAARLKKANEIKTEVECNLTSISSSSDDEPNQKRAKIELESEPEPQLNNQISDKPLLKGEDYEELRRMLRERKKQLMRIPMIRLRADGESARISVPIEDRVPLFLTDVQHLLLFASLGKATPYMPSRWCTVDKVTKVSQICILIVENMSLYQYNSHTPHFGYINETFDLKLEIVTPSVYRGDLVEEIAAVPLTSSKKQRLIEEYGSLEVALKSAKVFNMLQAVFPVQKRIKEKYMALPTVDKFPRTHLLLSAAQLVEEGYPVPLTGKLRNHYADYVLTKDLYEEVTHESPMFAVDCEMCKTTIGELELTRVSVVNEQHELVYETLVKPRNKIIDYLTQYSGITAKLLNGVTTRLEDVQRDLRDLLPADAILVGQSLNSDLKALRMIHPYIIDTSVIFNRTGERSRKTKLQKLAMEFLSETIQAGSDGHCSIEDSLSALKLVQVKLKHSIEFGDAILSNPIPTRQADIQHNYYGSSLLHHLTKTDRRAAVFGQPECINKYERFVHRLKPESCKRITCAIENSNKSVVKNACARLQEHNLILAHVKLNEVDMMESRVEKTCRNVNKWTRKLWTKLDSNSLCVVVFGGEAGGNGVCFVQIKKDTV